MGVSASIGDGEYTDRKHKKRDVKCKIAVNQIYIWNKHLYV